MNRNVFNSLTSLPLTLTRELGGLRIKNTINSLKLEFTATHKTIFFK